MNIDPSSHSSVHDQRPDQRPDPVFKMMSLERKLPLFITALLAIVLAAAVALAYREVSRSAQVVAVDRLERVSNQLAGMVTASTDRRTQLLRQAASDSAVQRAVTHPTNAANVSVLAALGRLAISPDSAMPIQLWTVEGHKVAALGEDGGDGTAHATQPPLVGGSRLDGGSPRLLNRSVYFGPFYVSHNAVYYWVAAPVVVAGEQRGWITQQGRLASSPETSRRLNGLIGGSSTAYFRNTTDAFWSTVGGLPVAAPTDTAGSVTSARPSAAADTTSYTHGGKRMLAAQTSIAGTSWAVVVEVPRGALTTNSRALLQRFALLCLALLVIGAASAWALSRSITRPLSALTRAAESVSRGEYATRVTPRANDEMARLATSFNRMAADVAAAHSELEQRVAEVEELADERDVALAAALSASSAKSSFLATMSHEIRTPINAILGYTDLMQLEIAGPLTNDQRSYVARVKASTEHLIGLVNEVLDLAKVESGTMDVSIAPGSTREVIDLATSLVQPQAAAKGIDLSVTWSDADAAAFVGDEQRVRQAVANLLSNAVKFTPPGGRIAITAEKLTAPLGDNHLACGAEYVAISVTDNGIGIAPKDATRVFHPFTQLETTEGNPYTRSASGAGLGLAISRQLARLMDGDITVESRVGEGSKFTLWLRALPASRSEVYPTAANPTAMTSGAAAH
ncbi:MAG: sensor histidine kinase [Gemmatimonadaceae bacterium]